TNVRSCEATPPDSGSKSSSSLHLRAPARLRPRDRNDNCSTGGVAQAFDLAAITTTVGAPFLRVLCEGAGTTNVRSCEVTPPFRNEIFVQPSFTRTGPARSEEH